MQCVASADGHDRVDEDDCVEAPYNVVVGVMMVGVMMALLSDDHRQSGGGPDRDVDAGVGCEGVVAVV